MGKLIIVATPIGNLEDITLRAIRVLGQVDVMACEDTRHTRKIFEKHGIHSPRTIISYREQNEEQAGARILGFIGQGVSVAICSDAGYRIISRALDDGHDVEVLPGAGRDRTCPSLLRASDLELHVQGLSATQAGRSPTLPRHGEGPAAYAGILRISLPPAEVP